MENILNSKIHRGICVFFLCAGHILLAQVMGLKQSEENMDNKIYIFIKNNVKVSSARVFLEDVAECTGEDQQMVKQCRSMVVKEFHEDAYGKYMMSAKEIVENIWKNARQVEIVLAGAPWFVLNYEKQKKENGIWMAAKTLFICLITFAGSMFSIMTFHKDVDLAELFVRIYDQVAGEVSSGFSVLEIAYSVGIAVGVIFFFNHFGKFRVSKDPSPIEVELCTYGQQVDQTVMEKESRRE